MKICNKGRQHGRLSIPNCGYCYSYLFHADFLALTRVREDVEKTTGTFMKSSSQNEDKTHLVNWNLVCLPSEEGILVSEDETAEFSFRYKVGVQLDA